MVSRLTKSTALPTGRYRKVLVIGSQDNTKRLADATGLPTQQLDSPTQVRRYLVEGRLTARDCIVAVLGSAEHALVARLWRDRSRGTNFYEIDAMHVGGAPEVERVIAEKKEQDNEARRIKAGPPRICLVVGLIEGGRNQVDALVDSALGQADQVIAVDDATEDGTRAALEVIAAANPKLTTIRHAEEEGLSAAINSGAQLALTVWPPSENYWIGWVFAPVPDDWSEGMRRALAENPYDGVAVVTASRGGPRLIRSDLWESLVEGGHFDGGGESPEDRQLAAIMEAAEARGLTQIQAP